MYGKVARVIRRVSLGTPANNPTKYDDVIIDYSYDAMGNRISKTVRRREGLAYNELGFGAPLAEVQAFLNKYPDAGNINGSPATAAAKISCQWRA